MISREDIFNFALTQYGTTPEYLWIKTPDSAVLRQHNNKKWYAIIMNVKCSLLGLEGDGFVDVLNVKCEPLLVDELIKLDGFLPAYHMNKLHWITILLDGTVNAEDIFQLVNASFELTFGK